MRTKNFLNLLVCSKRFTLHLSQFTKKYKTEILSDWWWHYWRSDFDALMDAGYEVTLIDRRDIGQGSTRLLPACYSTK